MLEASPFASTLMFFLGIVLYSPILLFSSGKYKSGLKCAAAICLWLLMMTGTTTLMSYMNPNLLYSLTGTSEKTTQSPKSLRVQADPSTTSRFQHSRSGKRSHIKKTKSAKRAKGRGYPNHHQCAVIR